MLIYIKFTFVVTSDSPQEDTEDAGEVTMETGEEEAIAMQEDEQPVLEPEEDEEQGTVET